MNSMATAPTWPLGSQKWLLAVCSKCLKLGRGRVKLKSLTAYTEQVKTTLLPSLLPCQHSAPLQKCQSGIGLRAKEQEDAVLGSKEPWTGNTN